MAADQPQIAGEGFASDIVSMTKQELYEIMCQMKDLIDQNKQQARQILIDNPQLSRGLFQAQIMLGMVNIPEVMPNIQETLSTPKSEHVGPLANAQPVPVLGGLQGQSASSSQSSIPARQEHQTQPSISLPAVSAPSSTFQSQPLPSNPPHSIQQTQGLLNAPQIPPLAPPSSQIHNVPLPPATSQYSMVQPQMPMVSGQMQQSLQSPGMLHQPLHPSPPPQQSRPPSMQSFPHQSHSQMPHGFQASSAPQPLLSQAMFQPASSSPTLITTYQLPQQLYQGGPHFGTDYGNHTGGSMHAERGAPWGPENTTGGAQMMGPPPPMGPGQMAPSVGAQPPPRPPPLTPEMEQVLLHQVMNLTPEQINLLPPEQRQQVIQLQQMLR